MTRAAAKATQAKPPKEAPDQGTPEGTEQAPETKPGAHISTSQMRTLHAYLRDHGITGDKAVHDYLSVALGRDVESRTTLTTTEAAHLIQELADTAVAYVPGGIVRAILAVQAALPRVAKTNRATVEHRGGGSHTYTYADLGAVSDAALPLLNQHGVVFMAMSRPTEKGYEVAGILEHVSGETRVTSLPLQGNDPQTIGGALTYYRRYLLCGALGLITDEDMDAQGTRGQAQTREWDGPTTDQLMATITADAARAGWTVEDATASFRLNRGSITVDDMAGLDPWVLAPFGKYLTEKADAAEAAVAQAAAETQQPDAKVWSTTEELLAQVDAWANRLGVTYEQATAKWRERNGNLTVDQLDGLPPEQLAPLETWLASYYREQEAAGTLPAGIPGT